MHRYTAVGELGSFSDGSVFGAELWRSLVGIVHVVFDVCCNGRAPGVQSLMIQVAKKASVLKRRKSRNRMDVQQQQQLPPVTISGGVSSGGATGDTGGQNDNQRMENEGDVIFYMEEPKAGTPNRARRDNRWVEASTVLFC